MNHCPRPMTASCEWHSSPWRLRSLSYIKAISAGEGGTLWAKTVAFGVLRFHTDAEWCIRLIGSADEFGTI